MGRVFFLLQFSSLSLWGNILGVVKLFSPVLENFKAFPTLPPQL